MLGTQNTAAGVARYLLPARSCESYSSESWVQLDPVEKSTGVVTRPLLTALGIKSKEVALRNVDKEQSCQLLQNAMRILGDGNTLVRRLIEIGVIDAVRRDTSVKAFLINHGGETTVFWELPINITRLAIKEFAETLIQLKLSPKDFVRVIYAWQSERYISKPIANYITAHYVSKNAAAADILKELNVTIDELSALSMSIQGPGNNMQVQSKQLSDIIDQLPTEEKGVFDDAFIGIGGYQHVSLLSVTLKSAKKSYVRNFYGIKDMSEEAYANLQKRLAESNSSESLLAEGAVYCAHDDRPKINFKPHFIETMSVAEKMSASEIFEQVMHIMCYDI